MGAKKDKKAKSGAHAETPLEPVFDNPNASFHERITMALDQLRAYFGMDFETSLPLPQTEGFQAPIDLVLMAERLPKDAWGAQVLVSGAVNCLWDSCLASLTPSVTVNESSLEAFIRKTWPEGVVKPLTEPVDFRAMPDSSLRSFTRLSPEEPVQAMVIHIARRIASGAPKKEMDAWKKCILSCPGRFIRADSFEEQYFWAVNCRRKTKFMADMVQHLPSQVVCDIWLFKRRTEAKHNKSFTHGQIADLYREHLEGCTEDEEPRSDAKLIENAVTVYDKVLSNPIVLALVQKAEATYKDKTPWSIAKLLKVYYKCKTPQRVQYCFQLIDVALRHGGLETADLSDRKLEGTSGKIGTLELVITKKGLRDFFMGRFLDCRNFPADEKLQLRKIFADPAVYEQVFLTEEDRSFASQWRESTSLLMQMVESTCFLFDPQESSTIKTGLKNSKTAQEIAEEYNPWKKLVEEIDQKLATEGTVIQAANCQEEQEAAAASENAEAAKDTSAGQPKEASEEGVDLSSVQESWLNYARRHISMYCTFVVEKGLSASALQKEIAKSRIGTARPAAGSNHVTYFDANVFGESVTSPHIRQGPLQAPVIQKMWTAVSKARAMDDQPGTLPPNDIVILVDGGRQNNSVLLKAVGLSASERATVDKGKKPQDGKTLAREIVITLDEASVAARKFRKAKGLKLNCHQKALIFYNGRTTIPSRSHKHFPQSTNMSNVLGPISLQAWQNLPKMRFGDKKTFWGARRRAVGGRSDDADDDAATGSETESADDNEEENQAVAGDVTMQLPTVGAGRGAKGLEDHVVQPVSYHQLPPMVADSLLHAFWAGSCVDLTPGAGDLCLECILAHIPYMGIVATPEQRDFIKMQVEKRVLAAMAETGSKVYEVETRRKELDAKRKAEELEKKKTQPQKKAKLTAPKKEDATGADTTAGEGDKTTKDKGGKRKAGQPSTGLSEALQKMLDAAKGGKEGAASGSAA
ncbi:unnamed protein product [Symbiodinium sp. CCMP2592]|nr:unnamed protein product [Symbiodinium sp. CCMP2592]